MGCLSSHSAPPARRSRLPALGLAALVLLSLPGRPAVADSVQQQLERVWSRSRQVEQEAHRREGRLEEIQAGVRAAAVAHARAQAELERARTQLARAEQDLQDAEAQVARTAAELAAVTERLGLKQQQLGQRVRALYLEGRVEYLEVLLGATSFGDFISRFHLLQSVVRRWVRRCAGVMSSPWRAAPGWPPGPTCTSRCTWTARRWTRCPGWADDARPQLPHPARAAMGAPGAGYRRGTVHRRDVKPWSASP